MRGSLCNNNKKCPLPLPRPLPQPRPLLFLSQRMHWVPGHLAPSWKSGGICSSAPSAPCGIRLRSPPLISVHRVGTPGHVTLHPRAPTPNQGFPCPAQAPPVQCASAQPPRCCHCAVLSVTLRFGGHDCSEFCRPGPSLHVRTAAQRP